MGEREKSAKDKQLSISQWHAKLRALVLNILRRKVEKNGSSGRGGAVKALKT